MKNVYIHSFDTRFGTIRTASTNRGVALVTLPGTTAPEFNRRVNNLFPESTIARGGEHNRRAESQLKKYFEGGLRRFDLKLDLRGTPFQKKVLKKVAGIPFGKTATYGDIAKAVGNPGAARAVGSANAKNLLPVIIPCHRVVATNGLGGYGGGLKLKKDLLKLEGAL